MTGIRLLAEETVAPFRRSGAVRRLYAVVLIDAVGMGMFVSFSVLYLTRVVGLSAAETGVAISVSGAASIIALMPLSVVAERIGARRALVVFSLCRAVSFALIAFATNFLTVVLAQTVAGLFGRIVTPVSQSVLIDMADTEEERITTLAASRMVRNAGIAVGALPGAVAAAIDTRIAYIAVIVAAVGVFGGSAWLSHRLPSNRAVAVVRRTGTVYRDWRFMLLTALNCLFLLHASILVVAFPLWTLQRTSAPAWIPSVLLLVNTVLAVVMQVKLSRGSEQPDTARKMLRRTGLFLAVVCVATPLSALLPGPAAALLLIVLAVLLTIGEVWNSAGAWGLVVTRLVPANRDQYLAFFNVGSSLATVIWPAAVGMLLTWGMPGWLVMAAFFAALGLLTPRLVRT